MIMTTTRELFEYTHCFGRETAITYEELQEAGWSIFEYSTYCTLCEKIRAAAILNDENAIIENYKKVELMLKDKCFDIYPIDKKLAQSIIKNWTCYGTDEYILPSVHRTSDDFRKMLERLFLSEETISDDDIFSNAITDEYDIYVLYADCEDYTKSDLKQCLDYLEEMYVGYQNVLTSLINYFQNPSDLTSLKILDHIKEYENTTRTIKLIENKIETINNLISNSSQDDASDEFGNTLYVHQGNIVCLKEKHLVENVTVTVKSFDENKVKLNVQYCNECNNYFIHFSVLEQYRAHYKFLIGDFKMVNAKGGFFTSEFERVPYHPIRLCGYTVSQKENLSDWERRYILAEYMGKSDAKKTEVINHLSMLIDTNGHQERNELAVSKWSSDREFVLSYNMESQRTAIIKHIKAYNEQSFFTNQATSPVINYFNSTSFVDNLIGKRVKHIKEDFGTGIVTGFDGTTLTILFDNKKNSREELKFDYHLMIDKKLIEFI